jgi:hypothetical protein
MAGYHQARLETRTALSFSGVQVTDHDALVAIIEEKLGDLAPYRAALAADAILAWMRAQGFRKIDATVIWRALRDSKANSDLVRAADVERALLATMRA